MKPRPINISGVAVEDLEEAISYEDLLKERDLFKERCESLALENRVLHTSLTQLDTVEVEMTEEQANDFTQELKEALSTMPYSTMCSFYTRERLLEYPTTIRYLIAVALTNCCAQLGKPGSDTWNEVITKQGAL